MNDVSSASKLADRSLLIVDSERNFVSRFSREMEQRGYRVAVVESAKEGIEVIQSSPPAYAVVDLKLGDGSGLDVISALSKKRPDARGIIVTGYGNIATAVAAVKLGAADYLAKPADVEEIDRALRADGPLTMPPPEIRCRPIACAGNISNASMSNAVAMFRKRHVASRCIDARCNAFLRNARRANTARVLCRQSRRLGQTETAATSGQRIR